MLSTRFSKLKHAVSRTASIAIVVVIIIIIVVGGYLALSMGRGATTTPPTQSTSTSTGTSSATTAPTQTTTGTTGPTTTGSSQTTTTSSPTTGTSSSGAPVPSVLTYETLSTVQYLDPQVSYDIYGASIEQNIYEPLLWFNGSNGQAVIPWLAQNYTIAPDGKTVNFTLRTGIKFADGETFNSTSVYFSYNRLLVMDGSAPVGHGTQASWIMQQLENKSLSTTFSGAQPYSVAWANKVLAQNFVQITGPYSVTLHIQNPNSALQFLVANLWANLVAPDYVMQHDIHLWSSNSTGYNIPYPNPSGNATTAINQYYYDEVATCNAGITPKGCAATYLDGSYNGSLAGTGPYILQSYDPSSNNLVLQKNPNYWGGPDHIQAQIPTIKINYVPQQNSRILDMQSASKSGAAMVIDVTNDQLYAVANRSAWLGSNQLLSTIKGITIHGPFTQYATLFDQFLTNVTDPFTGTYYKFQPFSDIRMRLAFADAVNLTEINQDVNNKMGQVANNVLPPGIPPQGAYNASILPRYSFNPYEVQQLLLDAMQHPLTQFTFSNGTAAPSGVFNNTFGCPTLSAQGTCSSPVAQKITLVYGAGQTVDEAIFNQIASVINNISTTYNMGLSVQLTPMPAGQMISEAFSGQLYVWAESVFGWYDDYPWSTDFLGPILAPGGIYTLPGGWNLTQMGVYWNQANNASQSGDIPALVKATNNMVALGNQAVMDIWTFYPQIAIFMTSNVQGFYFNPAIYTTGEPQYFAALY
ncbi:MAG TPA: ABC transporter substrate-binding protein [Nitrososphaerales archaeon]|nr:ABC transporter substrate-binding protein [Nitrososphaerales archaeon]